MKNFFLSKRSLELPFDMKNFPAPSHELFFLSFEYFKYLNHRNQDLNLALGSFCTSPKVPTHGALLSNGP